MTPTPYETTENEEPELVLLPYSVLAIVVQNFSDDLQFAIKVAKGHGLSDKQVIDTVVEVTKELLEYYKPNK